MNASDLFAALRDRWKLAAAIAVLLFAMVAIWVSSQPRQYQASASLLFDVSQPDPSLGDQERVSTQGTNLIGTQSDVIMSLFVAQDVVERLARAEGRPRPSDAALPRAARGLLGQVRVEPGKASNVLDIVVTDRDPQRAARVANLFAATFLDKQRDLRQIAARGYANWLDDRTSEVRDRVRAAQNRLADYQRARGVIGVDRMDLEAERLRSLNAELAQSEGEAAKASSAANAGGGSDVEFSGAVQQLRGSVAAQSGKVAELSRTLGPNHPDMVAARAELSALQGQLAAARSSAASAISSNSTAARQREAELRGRLQEQQARMIGLSKSQEDLAILQQDVDVARQTYESVRKRFGDLEVRSQITQTNATQLDRAAPPAVPSKPNVPLLLVLGLIFSTAAGVSAVLVTELLDPRVRTRVGVANAVRQPVVADYSDRPFGRFFGARA